MDDYLTFFLFTGKFEYRVTEESLMDRLSTDTHAACLLIHPDCRSVIPISLITASAMFVMLHNRLHQVQPYMSDTMFSYCNL